MRQGDLNIRRPFYVKMVSLVHLLYMYEQSVVPNVNSVSFRLVLMQAVVISRLVG